MVSFYRSLDIGIGVRVFGILDLKPRIYECTLLYGFGNRIPIQATLEGHQKCIFRPDQNPFAPGYNFRLFFSTVAKPLWMIFRTGAKIIEKINLPRRYYRLGKLFKPEQTGFNLAGKYSFGGLPLYLFMGLHIY
jgi:hypothetical protein